MGLFDDFKAHVLKQDTQPVDPDQAYTTHRTAADFSLSPAGQVLREVQAPKQAEEPIQLEAQLPGNKEPKPDTNDPNRRSEDELRAMGLSYDQIQSAAAQQEANRQGMLKESFNKAQPQPPVGLEAVTRMLDFPASKVRDAIAAKVSAATGANVTGDNLADYVGKATAPGDPVGQFVNSTLTSILTDPLMALPGLGIPSSAYKKGVEGVIKGIERASELSKGAGVDLAAERGSISLGGGRAGFDDGARKDLWNAHVNVANSARRHLKNEGFPIDDVIDGKITPEQFLNTLETQGFNKTFKPIGSLKPNIEYFKQEFAKFLDAKDQIASMRKEWGDLGVGSTLDSKGVVLGDNKQIGASGGGTIPPSTPPPPIDPAVKLQPDVIAVLPQKNANGTYTLNTLHRNNKDSSVQTLAENISEQELPKYLGASLAGKLKRAKLNPGEDMEFSGADLISLKPQTYIPSLTTDPATKYQQLVEVQRRAKKGETFSDKQVIAEANKLIDSSKLSAATIEQLAPGTALNAESQFAVHALAAENFTQIKMLADTATDEASMMAVIDAFWEHGQIFDAPRRGAIAETGRAERILGTAAPTDMVAKKAFLDQFATVAGKVQGGVSLQRAVELIKNIKTEDQLAILAKNATKPQLKDAFISLWVNSLLSGPSTHVANILGNSATLAWGVAERQLAGLMLGDVHPGEASAMVKGVFESFGDALQLGARAFMTNESKFGSTKLEQTKAVSFEEAGMAGVPGQALDYLSAFFQGFGGRPLLAADEVFKAINFRAEVRALALREAHAAVSSEQLTGKAARARVKELSEKYAADVPEHIHADAEQYAAYVTFTKELGPGGKWLQEGAATVPAVKLITPFIRTPINIFKYAGERTPFALFTKSMWQDIQAGGARRQLALAKVSMGAMVAGTGVLWAANGFITGGGPNPKKFNLDVMKEGGWQSYSVNVSAIKRAAKGGSSEWAAGDKLIAYNRVEPLGMLLGLYANYVDIVSNAEKDSDYEELAMKMTMATVKTMSSKTFIKGLSQTALAFAYPEEFMGETLNRQAVSFVPILGSSLSRGVARQIDPVVREAEGFIEELMKNTPILSGQLPPTLDILHGEPVYREGGVGPDIASSLYQSTYKDDPVVKEIVKNQVNVTRPSGIVYGVELNQEGKNELQYIITHDVKKGGRNLHASLEHLMDSAVYKNGTTGPDGRRALLIKSLMHAFTEAGQMKLLKKHPEIKQQVKDNQRAHADKMKSVRPVPSDEDINNADVDLEVGGF